jgi:predicted ABC-type ATPase
VADPRTAPCIDVLAGVNGAGKSSIAGAALRARGSDYFNPDEAARAFRAATLGIDIGEANAAAWNEGKRLLERAIAERRDFAFETTLGGNTIRGLLEQAVDAGLGVRMWYVGLTSPDLHIARVRARVARGGHDIPDEKIRERYDASRLNLIRLLPRLTVVQVYDNSKDADPHAGEVPAPVHLLHMERRIIKACCKPTATPQWAKPILAAAMKLAKPPSRG